MDKKQKDKFDKQVAKYCASISAVNPLPWCYPGDLIYDNCFGSLFICGDDPKDVAELRRRSLSFSKVNVDLIKYAMMDRHEWRGDAPKTDCRTLLEEICGNIEKYNIWYRVFPMRDSSIIRVKHKLQEMGIIKKRKL